MQNQQTGNTSTESQSSEDALRLETIAEKINRIQQFPMVHILPVIDTTYLRRLIVNYINSEQPHEVAGHVAHLQSVCMNAIELALPHLIRLAPKRDQDVCYEECERIFNVTPNDEEYHRIHSIVKGEVVKKNLEHLIIRLILPNIFPKNDVVNFCVSPFFVLL
jgi:hypothetical protein